MLIPINVKGFSLTLVNLNIFTQFFFVFSSLKVLVIFLQYFFQIRFLIKYLPCKLRVGNNPSVPIVLQGALADVEQSAHITVV